MKSFVKSLFSAPAREEASGTGPDSRERFWIDDSLVKCCYECDATFTLFNRRHHCRKCGKVFCSKCASNTIPSMKEDGEVHVRVCNYCYRLYEERPQTYGKFKPASKRLSMSHRLTASTVEESSPSSSGTSYSRTPAKSSAKKVLLDEYGESDSFGKSKRANALVRSPTPAIDVSQTSSASKTPRDVAVAGSYVEQHGVTPSSVTFDPDLDNSSVKEIIEVLGTSQKSAGQVTSRSLSQSVSGGDGSGTERSGGWSTQDGSEVLSPLDDDDSEVWSIPDQVLDLTADIGENSLQVKLFRYLQRLGNEFELLASAHLRTILKTLLDRHNLDPSSQWLIIIQTMVERAANNIDRLEMPGNAGQDPRDYIKVKRVASGRPEDSYLVKGLVFSKNIAHRRMPNDIKNPKILLLGCAIEYQRMQNRLSSLDILLEQEREHLRLSVARILQYNPTLIFVESTVARNAQELLLQAGVTLVLKVKPSLMNHISQLAGADVVRNLADIRPENFGTCEHFFVKTFKVSSGEGEGAQGKTKTLLFLDGCPYKAGCSIILKGSSLANLEILKKVVTFGVFAAYHHKIECKFLPLQCISAWNPESKVTGDKLIRRLRESFERTREKNKGCEISISPFMVTRPGDGEEDAARATHEISDCQHFYVSLASRCPSRGLLCEAPSVHDIAFYEQSDVSLVRFLRAALPEPNRHCPHPRCGDGPSKHIRAYVSGNFCVTLMVKELPEDRALPGKEANVIWAWRQGPKEKAKDCIRVPMTLDAGQISLGIFLQYFFSAPTLRGPDGQRLNEDYACFFGIGKGVARFTCERIKPLGVFLPPIPMSYNAEIDDKWLVAEGCEVLTFCEDILGRIENMIGRVKHKMKATTYATKDDYAKVKDLEGEVDKERAKLEVFVSPKSRSLTNFGEMSQLKVFEMNRIRKNMVMFASACISKAIYINDEISSHAPGHARKQSLLGSWFEQGGSDAKLNGSKDEAASSQRQPSVNDKSKTGAFVVSAEEPSISQSQSLKARDLIATPTSAKEAISTTDSVHWKTLSQSLQNKKSATDPANQMTTLNTTALSWSGRFTLPQGVEEKVVAVYDDEPTSLIGYVLMSGPYHERLGELKEEALQRRSASFASSANGNGHPSGDVSKSSQDGAPGADQGAQTKKELILSEETTHIRHSFEDFARDGMSKVHFQVTVYYATQFQEIRRLFGRGDETFIHSLLRCRKWETKGGKSNAYFAKTLDDRFVAKQMSKTEISSFLTFAPSYFRYMSTKLDSAKEECCLAKIFGVYQVVIKNPGSIGGASKDVRLDVMIMENIFYAKAISRIYDLKGSIRSRYNAEPSASNAVLLDENLLEILPASPILVRQEARAKLERALWKDTSFLAQLGVMDYSLLVGIDEVNCELVVGIIDYIRQYTWDKQLETWVKSSGILGGAGKVPTIISPKQYMKRFRIAMMVYFTAVPDGTNPEEDSLDPEALFSL